MKIKNGTAADHDMLNHSSERAGLRWFYRAAPEEVKISMAEDGALVCSASSEAGSRG
jgi:hypothetical protein